MTKHKESRRQYSNAAKKKRKLYVKSDQKDVNPLDEHDNECALLWVNRCNMASARCITISMTDRAPCKIHMSTTSSSFRNTLGVGFWTATTASSPELLPWRRPTSQIFKGSAGWTFQKKLNAVALQLAANALCLSSGELLSKWSHRCRTYV